MAKLTNVKERVQQPFRDALIRTSGLAAGTLSGQDQLFQSNNNQKTIGETNLRNGSTLPSDQSMIILALRVFLLFRNVGYRTLSAAVVPAVTVTGEVLTFPNNSGTDGFNSQLANTRDVMRLYEYAGSQIFWTFGAGEKPSISLMPTVYFPYGGGLVSDIGCSSDFIHVNNGLQTHGSMLKLARAILLVPRQQIQCTAQMQSIPTAGQATTYGTTQGSRDMYSVKDALNALDGMQKEVTFTFDGLLSRDVQLPAEAAPDAATLQQGPRHRPLHQWRGRGPCVVSARRDPPLNRGRDTPSQGDPHMEFQQWSAEVNAKLGHAERAIARLLNENAGLREQHAKMIGAIDVMKNTSMKRSNNGALLRNVYAKAWGGEGYVSLDDIEGRLIPYDYVVDIPIPSGQSQQFQGTIPISMEGPFVATHRVMAFRSAVTFQLTDRDGVQTSYVGRSSGRFRGISSAQDLFDAARAFEQINQYQPSYLGAVWNGATTLAVGNPAGVNPASTDRTNMLPNFPGSGRPIVTSPLSMAASRTMGFDGLVAVELAGANFRRQNQDIPSDFWQEGLTGSTAFSVYDVFDPGEVVTIKVTPTHVSNPAYGSISDLMRKVATYTLPTAAGVVINDPMPVGPFPFLEGQFDGHEGINDETIEEDEADQADPAVRVFDGILTVGFRGFRILSPPSPPPKK